jgi:hypothetical protein
MVMSEAYSIETLMPVYIIPRHRQVALEEGDQGRREHPREDNSAVDPIELLVYRIRTELPDE